MFYVIEISDGDKAIKGKGIYEYEDKTKALASYHKKLGTAMASPLFASEQIIVVDDINNVYAMDKFVGPYVEPAPEPVVEEEAAEE